MNMQMILRFSYAGVLLLGIVLLALGVVIDSSPLEKYDLVDSISSNVTLVKLFIFRAALLVFGVAFVAFSTLRLCGNAAALRLEERFRSLLAERPKTILTVLWIGVLVFVSIDRLNTAYLSWHHATGFEYYRIGQNLAEGKGFTFHSPGRWLYSPQSTPAELMNEFSAIAWEEPVYAAIVAFALSTWSDDGRLALVIFNIFAFLSTCFAVYYLGRKVFNRMTGLLASMALSLLPVVSHASRYAAVDGICKAVKGFIEVKTITTRKQTKVKVSPGRPCLNLAGIFKNYFQDALIVRLNKLHEHN